MNLKQKNRRDNTVTEQQCIHCQTLHSTRDPSIFTDMLPLKIISQTILEIHKHHENSM